MHRLLFVEAAVCVVLSLMTAGCEKKAAASGDTTAGTGPESTAVEPDLDSNNFKVDHPERFSLVTAGEYSAAPELNVTGTVSPDVARQVPVPSLATGRITEIDAGSGTSSRKANFSSRCAAPILRALIRTTAKLSRTKN